MAAIKLNQAELDALSGLGHAAFRLYVAAIRPRMDYGTGEVGRRVGISWQALREWMYVEPRPGVRAVTHTESMVRRLAKQLVKHGLLREIGDQFRIAFQCPLADTDNCAPKKADRGSTPPQAARQGNTSKDFKETRQTSKTAKADTHPRSGENLKTLKPSPPTPPAVPAGGAERQIESTTPAAPPIDNPLDETPSEGLPAASSEERHKPAAAVGNGLLAERGAKRGLSWEPHLAWPSGLSKDQRRMVATNLALAPENLREVVMDEWRGRYEVGGLVQPFAWLAHCAKQAARPGWVPTYAPAVRERRERAVQVLASHEAADAALRERISHIPAGPPPKGMLARLTRVAKKIRGE